MWCAGEQLVLLLGMLDGCRRLAGRVDHHPPPNNLMATAVVHATAVVALRMVHVHVVECVQALVASALFCVAAHLLHSRGTVLLVHARVRMVY
jgi:hypothetical protein